MHMHTGEKKQGSKHVPYAQLEALSANEFMLYNFH